MPNMSYCMFENTLQDLRDCLEKLYNISCCGDRQLSPSEEKAKQELIKVCREISEQFS